MTKLPISVFIIAKNEADRIGITIASVKEWAGEVIVVDSGSSDDTAQVAQAQGARVVNQPWLGYGLQKRFAEDQCKNRWLLNLDADEEITPKLAEEIRQLFAQGEPPLAGYIVEVKDLLPGEIRLPPLGHMNPCLRLYNREKGRFSDSPVHDSVILTGGKAGKLRHPVAHRSFRSIAHAIEKANAYSSVQALDLQKKGLAFPWLRLVIEFPMAFLKGYIIRGYYLRGWRGFVYANIYAFGRFARIAKYLELIER